MAYPDPRPLRILVIRYRFIGDTVLAIPFLRNLRAAFPAAKIDVLAEPGSGDTLALCPYKDELLYYAPRLKGEKGRSVAALNKRPNRPITAGDDWQQSAKSGPSP